jgi:hypothetical protein
MEMKVFKYKAHDSQARVVEGEVEAESREKASEIIRMEMGLFVTRIDGGGSIAQTPQIVDGHQAVWPCCPSGISGWSGASWPCGVSGQLGAYGTSGTHGARPKLWQEELKSDMEALSAALRAIQDVRGSAGVGQKTWESYDQALPHIVGAVVADSIKRAMVKIRG